MATKQSQDAFLTVVRSISDCWHRQADQNGHSRRPLINRLLGAADDGIHNAIMRLCPSGDDFISPVGLLLLFTVLPIGVVRTAVDQMNRR